MNYENISKAHLVLQPGTEVNLNGVPVNLTKVLYAEVAQEDVDRLSEALNLPRASKIYFDSAFTPEQRKEIATMIYDALRKMTESK